MKTATPTRQKCVICGGPATKKVIWADGRAYQPSCAADVGKTKAMLKAKNGDMAEIVEGVQDLSDFVNGCIDLVSSAVYPGLERKPGGPDNWVERVGGLPKYIERIAKHLHYERGMTISHAIASAVNTIKRWARKGKVAKYGDPNHMHVTGLTAAKAIATLAEWNAKKAAGHIHLSDETWSLIDAYEIIDLAMESAGGGASHGSTSHDTLGPILGSGAVMDTAQLARRTGEISDPGVRHETRMRLLNMAGFEYTDLIELAVPKGELTQDKRKARAASGQAMSDGSFPIFDRTSLTSAVGLAKTSAQRAHCMKRARALGLTDVIPDKWTTDLSDTLYEALDLAEGPGSTIAPKSAKGKTKDGRPSYKKQGKFKHGFIPVDQAAKEAKAKGSPKAMKRMNRLFGGGGAQEGAGGPKAKSTATAKPKTRKTGLHVQAGQGRAGDRSARGRKDDTQQPAISDKGINEKAASVGQLHRAKFADTHDVKRSNVERNKEVSKETRIPKRARQNWDEIPENLKTVRNGKRYVLAVFGGKNTLTEWVGGVHEVDSTPLNKRKVMRTLSSADASKMSSGQIRAMLKNKRQISPQVRKMLNKYLQIKIKEQRSRA